MLYPTISRKVFAIIHAQTISAPQLADGESWALTRAMSPRSSVRVAGVDAYGEILNEYVTTARVGGPAPEAPWAVYLAGTDRRFRLLCFDLDAKTVGAAASAAHDANVLVELLTDAGLEPVVCASGPSGGRHVWVALTESIGAETVATLARFTRRLCSTLDVAPLMNPVTGCVRPPGAPHRAGGYSTPIRGDAAVLAAPRGTAAQVVAVVEKLAALIQDIPGVEGLAQERPLPRDKHARLYLLGDKRSLPAVSAAALAADAARGDASAVLWTVLIGAAAARWRHADIAALVATSPGLEHIRTYRHGGRRIHRSPGTARAVLARQWDKAVRHVATTDRQVGDDPTFDARAEAIATHVRDLQDRADASAGRWNHRGGPADRRILDVLCLLALQALQPSVEADTRRLALLAGIGRETARTSLHRLTTDGWITPSHAATGPHGAHWKISPEETFHSPLDIARSQADPRAAGTGPAERTLLLETLTARTTGAAHDTFTPPALGLLAGNVYARTTHDPQPTDVLARTLGMSVDDVSDVVRRLSSEGLLTATRHGWRRDESDRRPSVATRLGVDGHLDARGVKYAIEREQWAWWQAEYAWMHSPRRHHPARRPGPYQLSLLPDPDATEETHAYGPYPRNSEGRADHAAALYVITTIRDGTALRTWSKRRDARLPHRRESEAA